MAFGPFLNEASKSWSLAATPRTPFDRLALRRTANPVEIICAAAFLASDASSLTTDSIRRADGGVP